MLKRLSTFRRKKDEGTEDGNVLHAQYGSNGVNGYSGPKSTVTATVTNGTSNTMSPAKKRFSFGPSKKQEPAHEETTKTSREDVDNSLEQFAQLVHASRRPLPTQTGDGSYIGTDDVPSSLFQDIKSLGFKDLGTLREVMLNKGELQDDKTMLMERVIQVSKPSQLVGTFSLLCSLSRPSPPTVSIGKT